MSAQPVKVTILGAEYVLSSDKGAEYVHRLARYVNEKMEGLLQQSEQISSLRVATMTALNIADELFALKDKLEEVISPRIRRMAELIEGQL